MAQDVSFSLTPEGDSALTVRFTAPDIDDATVATALEVLAQAALPAHVELVGAYTTLTVFYNPLQATYSQMSKAVAQALVSLNATAPRPSHTVVVPVCYGCSPNTLDLGPDLPSLASHCGLTPAEAVAIHCAPSYSITMIGFMPGFPYLRGLDPRLQCPRLSTPRPCIPAGSVAIGNDQTGIYPLASPGGWHLIGRTPARLFDPSREPPVPYGAKDTLRFLPIDLATFQELALLEASGHSCLRFE